MFLTVNGEKFKHGGDGTVPALLAELGATPEHTALTVNGELVFSKDWTRAAGESAFGISKRSDPKGRGKSFKLNDGDTVEVLTFVGGG
jgi:sulfur carrier protein ThiS